MKLLHEMNGVRCQKTHVMSFLNAIGQLKTMVELVAHSFQHQW